MNSQLETLVQYLAGQANAETDRLRNTDTLSSLPTIWDRLADAKLEGRYYFSDCQFHCLMRLYNQ